MEAMLSVAGGVVIGGAILGLIWKGITLSIWSFLEGEDILSLGVSMVIAGGAAAFWLLLIHTGIIPLS